MNPSTTRPAEDGDAGAHRPGAGAWALRHPYSIACAVALVTMGIGAVTKHNSAWDEVPLAAARLLLDGQDFYSQIPAFTYPPFTALVMVPFTAVAPRLGRGVWYVACAVSLLWMIAAAWRLAGGPPVEPDERRRRPGAPPREWVAFLLGHAVALQFALNALTHLQTDLLIGAMLIAGCAALVGGRWFAAATWIGLGAAFKGTPLLFVPYLLWRRRWAAAGWLLCVAIGANLLTDAVHRPPEGGTWLERWFTQYLRPMARPTYLPGDWKNQLVNNQSIAGAVSRFLTTTWQATRDDFKVYQRPGRMPTGVVRVAYLAACMAAAVPLLWVLWMRRGRSPPLSPEPQERPDPVAIECGMILLLMLLLSPNSSRAHFGLMYLPAFCVARVAVHAAPGGGRTLLGTLLGLSVACSTASIHLRLPGTFAAEQTLLWLGVVSASALFLLVASAIAARTAYR